MTPKTRARPTRVLVAKPGLDGHDRGAKVVAAALRDAGMEVIYTGLHQTPEMIATAAVQEDVDVVGLSILSGAHMTLFPRVLELLRKEGREDILITGGGIIPKEDMDALHAMGTGRLCGPGPPTSELIDYIRAAFAEQSHQEAGRGRDDPAPRAERRTSGSRSAPSRRRRRRQDREAAQTGKAHGARARRRSVRPRLPLPPA